MRSAHEGKKAFKCQVCNRSGMKRHMGSVHEGNRKFECDLCDYSSFQNAHMKRHIFSIHEGRKPFKCDICDHSYSSKANMKTHVISSWRKEGFQMQKLWLQLLQKHHMSRQITLVHEGEKAFQCKICDRNFSTRRCTLIKFMKGRSHFNAKCVKIFSLKDNMSKHIASVHEGKNHFKCEICDKSFFYKNDLNKHIASVQEGKKVSNVKYVTKAFSARVIWINTFYQFMKEENHSAVIVYHEETQGNSTRRKVLKKSVKKVFVNYKSMYLKYTA